MLTHLTDERSPELTQRLRRLGLIDDNEELPELDIWPEPIQRTLLSPDGTRSAMRLWRDSRAGESLPLTGLLIVLSHMREHAGPASKFFRGLSIDFADELARCALDTGRALHVASRRQFSVVSLDLAVNAALEAQAEFLFAITSGRLSGAERTEALGKYAVAVALSARWRRPEIKVLNRAYEFQLSSIQAGNRAPEAYTYLVELRGELFNQSGDESHLDEAIRIATDHSIQLAEAELLLRRGLVRSQGGSQAGIPDLQRASDVARRARVGSGVEYVQRALIQELALSAIVGKRPLGPRQIRLPYGFLQDLAGLSASHLEQVMEICIAALAPMKIELKTKRKPPNLVAQEVSAGIYRQVLDRSRFGLMPTADLLVQATEEAAGAAVGNRHLRWQHADALLAKATRSLRESDIVAALAKARVLIHAHPSWPLPRVTLARALQLDVSSNSNTSNADVERAWGDVIDLVTASAEFRRADLGGRSGVFAVDDARGDLSTTLVFKPVETVDVGRRESEQLGALRAAIEAAGASDRFGVPASLGVFQAANGKYVHVIERHPGTLLSALEVSVAASHLGECADLLALFQGWIGIRYSSGPGWRELKDRLKPWCKALFPDERERAEMLGLMRAGLPAGLPLAKKRDSHPGNWVVDAVGRVVAIDLGSPVSLPVGHDLAQLVEDGAFLPVTDDGFARRYALFSSYLNLLHVDLEQSVQERVYDWFALYRAIWIATSNLASKAHHAHARQLARHLASKPHPIGPLAEFVSAAMQSQFPISNVAELSYSQRRISKSMSKVLRHSAVDAGLEPDSGGFVTIQALAKQIRQGVDVVIEIASHPTEPRFQVIGDRIRALYGHSFPVRDLHKLNVEVPETLFHGSSWDHLSMILSDGLLPRARQHVHLTNNPAEAIEVARRHGHAVLLAVATSSVHSLRAVADAVWAANGVNEDGVRVLNAFMALATPPQWLAEIDP